VVKKAAHAKMCHLHLIYVDTFTIRVWPESST
jgi:hypothetical protein